MPDPVRPARGLGVLHLFLRVDRVVANDLPASAGKDLEHVLASFAEDETVQLHLFSGLGHKADIMVFALAADLGDLRRLQTAIEASDFGPALDTTWSYVSLTETSEYMPTLEAERAKLEELGLDDDELERRLGKTEERLEAYARNKLYPDMPAWEVACFYPMSHRREGEDNWYSLPFDERQRLMHEHGKSGRAYTGRVLQLISGSTGIDDWEWAVTLFAHDVGDLKEIVYSMRYDEASARFAEFGPFVLGLRRTAPELVRELGIVGA